MTHAVMVKGTSRTVMLMMPKMLRHVARNEKRRTALRLSQQQRTRCPCFACLMPRSVERRGVGSTMVRFASFEIREYEMMVIRKEFAAC